MQINLTITADTIDEFDTALARFAPRGGVMPELLAADDAPPLGADFFENGEIKIGEKVVRKGRGKKTEEAAAPTQNPDGSPIAPVSEPVPQPTPGGTDAPPAESIPPNQTGNATSSESGAASEPTAPAAETVAATPSAGSPVDTAAAEAGEVTIQMLKDALGARMKRTNTQECLDTLVRVTGCKSLTTGSPNVAEKAKEDPTILRTLLTALNDGA